MPWGFHFQVRFFFTFFLLSFIYVYISYQFICPVLVVFGYFFLFFISYQFILPVIVVFDSFFVLGYFCLPLSYFCVSSFSRFFVFVRIVRAIIPSIPPTFMSRGCSYVFTLGDDTHFLQTFNSSNPSSLCPKAFFFGFCFCNPPYSWYFVSYTAISPPLSPNPDRVCFRTANYCFVCSIVG